MKGGEMLFISHESGFKQVIATFQTTDAEVPLFAGNRSRHKTAIGSLNGQNRNIRKGLAIGTIPHRA